MAQALSQRPPTSETHVLKMLSQGAPMTEVLNELCNFIDAKSPGVIPTVLLPDGDGHLRLAAGPKVPKTWNEAFDGMKLPSYASFLRTAGHQGGPVPVADMRSDPSFAACWEPGSQSRCSGGVVRADSVEGEENLRNSDLVLSNASAARGTRPRTDGTRDPYGGNCDRTSSQ